jgi:hypothetical protein
VGGLFANMAQKVWTKKEKKKRDYDHVLVNPLRGAPSPLS